MLSRKAIHPAASDPAILCSNTRFSELLTRPVEHRLREFRYRTAQTVIFGLPVLGLQWWGPRLGGPESARWIALFQSLMAGWVVYIAVAGLVVEGFIVRRGYLLADLGVGVVAIAGWAYSLAAALPLILILEPRLGRPCYHGVILLLVVWSGFRWIILRGRSNPGKGL